MISTSTAASHCDFEGEVGGKMSVRLTLSCKTESVRFSERLLEVEPGDFVPVGRADTNNRADLENGYFNCKVDIRHLSYR